MWKQNQVPVDLIVIHLPNWVHEEMLRRIFSDCGPVISTRIMRNDDGSSRGFGLVSFPGMEEASRAINMKNGFHLGGNALRVTFAKAQAQQPSHNAAPGMFAKAQAQPGRIQKNEFPPEFYPREQNMPANLHQKFQRHVGRNDSHTMEHPFKPRKDNFAEHRKFNPKAKYSRQPPANLGPKHLEDRFNTPSMNQMAETNSSGHVVTICITGIPSVCAQSVGSFCAVYGKVKKVKQFHDRNGISLGIASVDFFGNEAAMKAVKGLHGLQMMNNKLSAILSTN